MSPPAGRRPIRKLDEATIREIAAGEVVERPASVVKELVENSLDAGARSVEVRIEQGGLALIEVADDGSGLPAAEFPLAFERHATSKLVDASHLAEVSTLGFRGEALASIAAVARVRFASRVSGKEAHEMEVEAGHESPLRPTARAPGTTVTVRDLFFNTPARRKFLRSVAAETLQVADVVERLYLANPSVTLTLSVDGKERARYPRAGTLREAAAQALGPEFAERAFEFQGIGGPGVWVEGVASHPSVTRGTSSRLIFSANGRAIASRAMLDGLRAAYFDLIPRGRYPLAAVRLTVEPGYVDVNVHPTKREVRFQDESEIREALRTLVRSHLQSAPLPSGVPFRAPPSPGTRPAPDLSYRSAAQRTLSGIPAPVAAAGEAPPAPSEEVFRVASTLMGRPLGLRVLGQVGDLFIVAESPDQEGALVVVDAHAASERVAFERLRATTAPGQQELLVPVELELTPRQASTWNSHRESILAMGFSVEPFGGNHYRVLAVPAFLWHRVDARRLAGLLDELADGEKTEARENLHDRVAKTVACHMAIRGGDPLTLEEMRHLLEELASTPDHFTCPHGRPVMVSLPRAELNRWFHR